MFSPSGHLDLLSFMGMRGGGKGGGGGGISPQLQQQQFVDPSTGLVYPDSTSLNTAIQDRQATEAQTSATDKATADAKAVTDENTFKTSRQKAYDDALASVSRQFQLQGVDPASYMTSDITPTLQRQFNSIQDLDPNPAAAFPTTLGDTIVGNVTSGKRQLATNSLNSMFTPQFTNNLLPDATPNSFVDQILNEQFNPLGQQLTNAENRGTLNPTGYNAALAALDQKKTAARATVQNLGQGILDTDRTGINDIIGNARSTVNNLSLADSFDPSTFAGQATSRASTDLGNFGGALRSAVGDTKFADIQDLLNAGGSVQGATNPTAANPAGGITGASPAFVSPDELARRQRGLGNQGAF